MDIQAIIRKITAGQRIDFDAALALLKDCELLELGGMADEIRRRLHPDPVVTYVVDRNINYTNICCSGCLFCAYYRSVEDPDAWVLSKKRLKSKIEETLDLGGTQILLQGGLNPDLSMDYYIDLLSYIKTNFSIHVHGFSPPEIAYISNQSNMEVREVLKRLIQAGLDSIPGGGAEILVDEVRKKVSPGKCDSETWLNVMKTAHALGLRTTATMMFGHHEKPEHIIEHLIKIRSLQDETGGFTAFIPWTFQPNHTRMGIKPAGSVDYLKVLALSRIVLDNIPNIQASWVTQGDKIAQVSLVFGANDMGSTMIEENVVAAAGVRFKLPESEMVRLINDAGFEAIQRDFFYRHLGPGLKREYA